MTAPTPTAVRCFRTRAMRASVGSPTCVASETSTPSTMGIEPVVPKGAGAGTGAGASSATGSVGWLRMGERCCGRCFNCEGVLADGSSEICAMRSLPMRRSASNSPVMNSATERSLRTYCWLTRKPASASASSAALW